MDFGAVLIKQAKFFLAFWAVSIVLGSVFPVQASERLLFNQDVSASSQLNLTKFTTATLNKNLDAFEIAKIDLNHDGLYEFILKDGNCTADSLECRFKILAETDTEITELGSLQARTLIVSDQNSHGIRDLLVFQNEHNDYDYDIYVWEPMTSRYILGDGKGHTTGP